MQAVRASHLNLVQLAALCEYAAHTQLSRHLNAPVAITPLNTRRVRLLAELVGHEGDIFERERGRRG